jgi:hypothetical protein
VHSDADNDCDDKAADDSLHSDSTMNARIRLQHFAQSTSLQGFGESPIRQPNQELESPVYKLHASHQVHEISLIF